MRNAIILHGLADQKEYYGDKYPNGSNSHWLPWLQKRLITHDIKADTPDVPRPFDFDYQAWVKEVERFEMTTETTLVGHSMGGGFLLRYLSERPDLVVDKVILVAPWLNLNHEEKTDFFDIEIDPSILDRVGKLVIFASDNDDVVVQDSIALLKEVIPNATYKEFHEYGHFTLRSMGTDDFPELLEVIL
jgi:predicted alpha/beta hydrolase family esterase